MANSALGFLIKQMDLGVVQHDINSIAGPGGGGGLHAGRKAEALHIQI